jgi:lysozyme family protein
MIMDAVQTTAFDQALTFVLRLEGGYANHPADRGGATMKGITQAVYDDYRMDGGLGAQAVKLISDEEVRAIYHQKFWRAGNCHRLRSELALAHFDTAVNMGIGRATRILQEAAGCAADGTFGPATQAACDSCELRPTLERYCEIREGWYRNRAVERPDQKVFLKGWLNRMKALRKELGVPVHAEARDVSYGALEDVSDIEFALPDSEFSFSPRTPDLAPGQTLETWR